MADEQSQSSDIIEDARAENLDAMEMSRSLVDPKAPAPAEDFDFSEVEGAVLQEPQTEEVVKAKEASEKLDADVKSEDEKTETVAKTEEKSEQDSQGLREDQIVRAAQLGVPFDQVSKLDAKSADALLATAEKYIAAQQAQQFAYQQAQQQAQVQQQNQPKPFDEASRVEELVKDGWDESIAKKTANQEAKIHELEQKFQAQQYQFQQAQWQAQQTQQRQALDMFNAKVVETVKGLGDAVQSVVSNDAQKVARVQAAALRLFNSYQQGGLQPPAPTDLISQATYMEFGKDIADHAAGKRAKAADTFRKGATDRAAPTSKAVESSVDSVKARFAAQMAKIVP